jgi:hypothetical protein
MRAARARLSYWFAKSLYVLTRGAQSEGKPLTHWNACLGIWPILIESPLRFFGIQMVVGIVCLFILLIFG